MQQGAAPVAVVAKPGADGRRVAGKILATLGAIFTRYIGVLAGIRVIKGIMFLPLFIAVTAADRFGTSRFTALAAAMVYSLTSPICPRTFPCSG